jgi:cytochrome c553
MAAIIGQADGAINVRVVFGYNRRPKPRPFSQGNEDMNIRAGMVGLAAAAVLAAGSAAAQTAPAPAGDAAAGRQKNSMCVGCHGIEGYKTAFPEVYNVPKIGGQHPAYIVKALQAYKSGERNHPSMKGIAATLSDKDMADLAAYYSAGPSKVAAK